MPAPPAQNDVPRARVLMSNQPTSLFVTQVMGQQDPRLTSAEQTR